MIVNWLTSHSVCALAAIVYAILFLGVFCQRKYDL